MVSTVYSPSRSLTLPSGRVFFWAILLFPFSAIAEEWTTADTVRESAYVLLHIADWNQTREIARNPQQYWEVNPVLGKHPSIKRVDSYMAFSALAHIGISYAIAPLCDAIGASPRKCREGFQYLTLGGKASLVYHNNRIGLSWDFK